MTQPTPSMLSTPKIGEFINEELIRRLDRDLTMALDRQLSMDDLQDALIEYGHAFWLPISAVQAVLRDRFMLRTDVLSDLLNEEANELRRFLGIKPGTVTVV